jgi:SRSO17 transposase
MGHKPLLVGTAEAIARDLGEAAWQRLSAGAAARAHGYCELADLDASEYDEARMGGRAVFSSEPQPRGWRTRRLLNLVSGADGRGPRS